MEPVSGLKGPAEGASQVKSVASARRVTISTDGRGLVPHAGMGLLRELADATGLCAQVTAVLADAYRGPWVYAPGRVFTDLATAVARGTDCIDGTGQLRGDREQMKCVQGQRPRQPRCGDSLTSASTSSINRRFAPPVQRRGRQPQPRVQRRPGAWVAEATGPVNLATWPAGTRLALRDERPPPPAPDRRRYQRDNSNSPLMGPRRRFGLLAVGPYEAIHRRDAFK